MTIEVKVLPKSRRDEISGVVNGILKVRVSAPPSGGKANERLIDLFSKAIDVPRSNLTIIKGITSRIKTLCIEGAPPSKLNWFKRTYFEKK